MNRLQVEYLRYKKAVEKEIRKHLECDRVSTTIDMYQVSVHVWSKGEIIHSVYVDFVNDNPPSTKQLRQSIRQDFGVKS